MACLEAFLDRNQPDYLDKIIHLLSIDSLINTAKPLNKNDVDDQKILERSPQMTHKATIYFSGLAGLTLFGTDEKHRNLIKTAIVFHSLLEEGVAELNKKGVVLQIRLLFAYPYSNFMYDLLYLEKYDHLYLSTDCIKKNLKYEYSFQSEPRLSVKAIDDTNTVKHLKRTLRFIQDYVNEKNDYWNKPPMQNFDGSPNIIVVKFCPINVLCCMLRINNVIFIDPYVYSKEKAKAKEMALRTPISWIELPIYGPPSETKEEEQKNFQFHSFISHFKYLWEHILTLYAADATNYRPYGGGLDDFKLPSHITYEKKGNRIERKIRNNINQLDINELSAKSDNWKQFVKNEFLMNCSKVLTESSNEIINREIQPLKIFIVGSWPDGRPHPCMELYETWIIENLSGKNNQKGLQIEPIILELENGEEFIPALYRHLNTSHLGLIIQTVDIATVKKEKFSKPNVYLEKGYLMGKLRKRYTRIEKKVSEPVFVFKQKEVAIESDNSGIGYTSFDNQEHCKAQLFKFIYWLWQISSLNSRYALELIDSVKTDVYPNDEKTYLKYVKNITDEINSHKKRNNTSR
jgi:hypothetical protein